MMVLKPFSSSVKIYTDMDILRDHIHMIIDVSPKRSVFTIVNMIKAYTSHELREEFRELKSKLPTLWTRSKFISTVGVVTLEVSRNT